MRDEEKTQEQLISELVELRQWVAELGVSQAENKYAEVELTACRERVEELAEEHAAELMRVDQQLQHEAAERLGEMVEERTRELREAQEQLVLVLPVIAASCHDSAPRLPSCGKLSSHPCLPCG